MEVDFELDVNFWMAMFFVPLFWWAVHALMGMYADVRRRHRGLEVRQVTRASAMGGVLLFFALLLDDVTTTHIDHYETLGVWLTTHASLVLLGRWCWTAAVVHRVQSGDWAFSTILVGTEDDNASFREELNHTPGKMGWNVLASMSESELETDLGKLGRCLDGHA